MYIISHYEPYEGNRYSVIEEEKDLDVWMKDGSIQEGDFVYKVVKKYSVLSKKELKLLKLKEKKV
jgi:hypothetical protein